MGVSLFEHLDLNENFTELIDQYRMNVDIMNIANDISYNGKLKCNSISIANQKLKFSEEIDITDKILARELVFKSVLFIDTQNVLESVDQNDSKMNKSYNILECDIIKSICKFFIRVRDRDFSFYRI